MFVKAVATLPDYDEAIILDELNVKNITFTDDVSNFTTYNFKSSFFSHRLDLADYFTDESFF